MDADIEVLNVLSMLGNAEEGEEMRVYRAASSWRTLRTSWIPGHANGTETRAPGLLKSSLAARLCTNLYDIHVNAAGQ